MRASCARRITEVMPKTKHKATSERTTDLMSQGSTRRRAVAAARVFAAFVLLGVAGCGGHEKETATVKGTVLLDGQPFTGGAVVFTPAAGRAAMGKIAPDGSYTLGTYRPGDGAIVGHHQVSVVPPMPVNETDPVSPLAYKLPPRYGNGETSGLEFDVESDKENTYDIKLSSSAR